MRVRAIALAALLAVGLVGCTSSTLAVFDRPQVESDVVENAAKAELDPDSTRLLWQGSDREIYAAQRIDNSSSMCMVIVTTDVAEPFVGCGSADRIGVSLGSGEEYILVRFEIGEEADGWEQLAEGLWRKL